MSLISQPDDIIFNICQYTDYKDIINLKQTSKRFTKVEKYHKNRLDRSKYKFIEYKFKYLQNIKRNIQKNSFYKLYDRDYRLITTYFKVLNKYQDFNVKYEYVSHEYGYSFDLITYNINIANSNYKDIIDIDQYMISMLQDITNKVIIEDQTRSELEAYCNYKDCQEQNIIHPYKCHYVFENFLDSDVYTPTELDNKIKDENKDKIYKKQDTTQVACNYFLDNSKILYLKYRWKYIKLLKQSILKTQNYDKIITYFSLLYEYNNYLLQYNNKVFTLSTHHRSILNNQDKIETSIKNLLEELTNKKITILREEDENEEYIDLEYTEDDILGYIIYFEIIE
jgi:hypothetical protein